MSTELFSREGLTVTSYTGPERSDSVTRQRVQVYNHHGGDHRLIDLAAEQWTAIGDWFEEHRNMADDSAGSSAPRRSRSSGTG